MGMWRWVAENWFTLLQTAGIVGSLLFTAFTIRADSKARRIDNLISITGSHREIWRELYVRPELARVLDASADLIGRPISADERIFVLLVILHLCAAYRAIEAGVLKSPEGMQQDVRSFFSLPIPAEIWKRNRDLQDHDFVEFVETC